MPRSARWAASEQLVPVTDIKVIRPGIHLVFEDAVRSSSRCEADDEHAPTGSIHPDGMSLLDGRSGDEPASPRAGSSFALSAHRHRLRQLMGSLGQPGPRGCRAWVMTIAEAPRTAAVPRPTPSRAAWRSALLVQAAAAARSRPRVHACGRTGRSARVSAPAARLGDSEYQCPDLLAELFHEKACGTLIGNASAYAYDALPCFDG